MDKHPIDVAAAIMGSQAALASALGVTKAAVSQWKDEGRRVPAEHCPAIERLTSGAVRCEQLRPDVQWDVLREQAPAAPVIQKPAQVACDPVEVAADSAHPISGAGLSRDEAAVRELQRVLEKRERVTGRRSTDKPH